MKFTLITMMILGTTISFAQEVKDFNRILIETVQKDIKEDNAEELKMKSSITRGPASVENVDVKIQEESKIEKNMQMGNKKW